MDVFQSPLMWTKNDVDRKFRHSANRTNQLQENRGVEMAGFNALVSTRRFQYACNREHRSIARAVEAGQSKKLMRGIKGIYFGKEFSVDSIVCGICGLELPGYPVHVFIGD
jgi:hypothetical protein